MAFTRSAVRSRLAPPRFAFGFAWRSHAEAKAKRVRRSWSVAEAKTGLSSDLRRRRPDKEANSEVANSE